MAVCIFSDSEACCFLAPTSLLRRRLPSPLCLTTVPLSPLAAATPDAPAVAGGSLVETRLPLDAHGGQIRILGRQPCVGDASSGAHVRTSSLTTLSVTTSSSFRRFRAASFDATSVRLDVMCFAVLPHATDAIHSGQAGTGLRLSARTNATQNLASRRSRKHAAACPLQTVGCSRRRGRVRNARGCPRWQPIGTHVGVYSALRKAKEAVVVSSGRLQQLQRTRGNGGAHEGRL